MLSTLGSARQGGIGWGPSHAPRFCTHGAIIQTKMTQPGLRAFSARLCLLTTAGKKTADVSVAHCVSPPFSRAQRHACHHGLTWTGRGRGPAISLRTGEQTLPCCPFLQCKHQPAKGASWGGSDPPGEEEPFASMTLPEMSTELPLLQFFLQSLAWQGSLGCRGAQMELQP